MAKSGYIKEVKYNLLGGIAASTWYPLGVIPPSVENGVSCALAVTWENTGDEAFQGHIVQVLTDPDGGVVTVGDHSGQNANIAAAAEGEVIFEPSSLSVDGIYAAEFTLTEHTETTVYDVEAAQIASVSTTPAPDTTTTIDINTLITPLISIMIVMMMMKMMTGAMKQIE